MYVCLFSVRRFGALRSAGVFLVIVALLLSQTMGLLHSVLHAPLLVTAHAPTAFAERQHNDDGHRYHDHVSAGQRPAGNFLAELFSEHLSDTDCRLYDQAGHFDGLVDFAAPLLPLILPIFVLAFLDGLVKARWHAQFQARGPPSSR